MHTFFFRRNCACYFFMGIDKVYPNKWGRNYGNWRKDRILNCSSGKMPSACWWTHEHESQFPLSKRVKCALLFKRLGFAFKSFTSTTLNKANPSYSQPPPPDLNLWCKNIHTSRSDPRSSTFTQLECTSVDCNGSWTEDPAVGQISSRDNQSLLLLSWEMSQKPVMPGVRQDLCKLQAVLALKDWGVNMHRESSRNKSTFL